MFLKENWLNNILKNLENNLRELGFPKDKLSKAISLINESYNSASNIIKIDELEEKLYLKPNEKRMLLTAIFNLNAMKKA